MKFSNKQKKTLAELDRFIGGDDSPPKKYTDEVFMRGIPNIYGEKTGKLFSGEEAFFAYSDRGMRPHKDEISDPDRYKQLILGQRLYAITIASMAEDVPWGIISWPELMEESEFLCNSVRRAVGLRSISKDTLMTRIDIDNLMYDLRRRTVLS